MIKHKRGIGYLCADGLEDAGIMSVFLTRHRGYSNGPFSSLNLGLRTEDDPEAVGKNEEAVRNAFGIKSLVRTRQVHGGNAIVVKGPVSNERDFLAMQADALVTCSRDVALAVLTADCYPVVLVESSRPVAAMIHAGRKGVCAGIIQNTARVMVENFNADPRSIIAAIGPGIGPCCYEVDENIARDFRKTFPENHKDILADSEEGLFKLDLPKAIDAALMDAGINKISRIEACTSCREDLFFSHRRDKGITGRQINLVMIT